MKKLLTLLVFLAMATSLFAGYHSSYAVGNVTEYDDEILILTHPAVLQKYNNFINLGVAGGGTNAWILGGIWKYNSILGLGAFYEQNIGTSTIGYVDQTGAPQSFVVDWSSHASLASWGAEFGDTFSTGLGWRNIFATDLNTSGNIKSQTYSSNGGELDHAKVGGFVAELMPSVALKLGDMSLWVTVPMTLNFMKIKAQNTGLTTNAYELKPAVMQTIGANVYFSMPFGENISWGINGNYTFNNFGWKTEVFTNDGTAKVTDLTNAEGGDVNVVKSPQNSFLFSTGLKFSVGDVVNIYLDTRFGMTNTYGAYNEGDNEFDTRTKTRTIVLPTPILAAEGQVAKWLKLRISAVPGWTRIINGPVKTEGGTGVPAAQNVTTTDIYTITPNVGLGFIFGPFVLDTVLSATFFNTYITDPLQLPASIFNSSVTTVPLFIGFDLKFNY